MQRNICLPSVLVITNDSCSSNGVVTLMLTNPKLGLGDILNRFDDSIVVILVSGLLVIIRTLLPEITNISPSLFNTISLANGMLARRGWPQSPDVPSIPVPAIVLMLPSRLIILKFDWSS